MKIVKQIAVLFSMITLFFVACNTAQDKNTEETVFELNDGTTVLLDENNNLATVNNWGDFNSANEALLGLESRDYEISMNNLENLRGSIANLSSSIPQSLRTEEVLEDIEDVQEEYRTLMNESNEPVKNIKQNIEELVEKFDDLREELYETVEDYSTK